MDYNRNWHGYMTLDNMEDIAHRCKHMLTGKKYTFVATNERHARPTDVRVDQKLKGELSTYREEDVAGFHFGDTYGVWGCSTSKYEMGKRKNPYFDFTYNRIEILQYNGYGEQLCWIIQVQE